MADIFISYSSEDKAHVKPLVAVLEHKGYSVWWDNELRGGSRFSEEIEAELTRAKAVVVVWTEASRKSRWVTDEADSALNARKLVPIRLDDQDAPIGFRQIQTIDFKDWEAEPDGPALKTLNQAIQYHLTQSNLRAEDPHAARDSDAAPEGSIAVLPFVNMSSDPEQEFFSDGISEELLNLLAKINNLKVTARTSSFQFKDKNLSISTIADVLGVAHILEGSVRKAGNRVRITAQLIKASDGFHLWSETYDRVLEDVFAIQDEIASAIVDALKEKILLNPVAPAATRSSSVAAYEEYLLGQQILQQRTAPAIARAKANFQAALNVDPDFLPALVGMAEAILYMSDHSICYGTHPLKEALGESKFYLDKAHSLDPHSEDAHLALSIYFYLSDDLGRAQSHAEKAIGINANSSKAYRILGLILKKGANPRALVVKAREKALSLNPVSTVDLINLLEELPIRLRYEEAAQLLERIDVIEPNSVFSSWGAFQIAWNRGQLRKCLGIYLANDKMFTSPQWFAGIQSTLTLLGEGASVEAINPASAFEIYCLFGRVEDANRMAALQGLTPNAASTDAPSAIVGYWHLLNGRLELAHDELMRLDASDPTDWGPLFNIDEFCVGARALWFIKTQMGDTAGAELYKRKLHEAYSVYVTDIEGVHRTTHYIGACVCMMDGDKAMALREARHFADQSPAYAQALLTAPMFAVLKGEPEFQELEQNAVRHIEVESEKARLSQLIPLKPEQLEKMRSALATQ